MTHYHYMPSPLGQLLLAANQQGLQLVQFEHSQHARDIAPDWQQDALGQHPVIAQAKAQLAQYFAGQRRHFELPLAAAGTEFQQRVWQGLVSIGYGETLDYAGLAERIGSPRAVRAVGAANGRNPLPIIVPCHRVIGRNGSPTGFSGGLEIKRFLLALERGM